MFEEITKENKVDVARWRADPKIGGRRKILELQLREQAEKKGVKFVYAKMMDYLIELGMDAHEAKEKPVQSNLPPQKSIKQVAADTAKDDFEIFWSAGMAKQNKKKRR